MHLVSVFPIRAQLPAMPHEPTSLFSRSPVPSDSVGESIMQISFVLAHLAVVAIEASQDHRAWSGTLEVTIPVVSRC